MENKEERNAYYVDDNEFIVYPLTEDALHVIRKMLEYSKIYFEHEGSHANKVQEFVVPNADHETKNDILEWFYDPEEICGTEDGIKSAVIMESDTTTALICAGPAKITVTYGEVIVKVGS